MALDLTSGRYALIERAHDFTLVPWQPLLQRRIGQPVAGIMGKSEINWSLGRTPPPHFATQSNRMSPTGIPMFYGAFDADTAWAENFDPALHAGQVASVGTFRPTRDLKVLDLAQLPPVPSIFDSERRNLLNTLRFLHRFADDVSKPIARDGREHMRRGSIAMATASVASDVARV